MTILDTIVVSKRKEVAQAKTARPLAEVMRAAEAATPARPFAQTVMGGEAGDVRLIAEIKKASPSAGIIVSSFDPVDIARTYEASGASAISVLTDEPFFQGRLEYIAEVKAAAALPVLRKDFILEAYQVYESRAAGADCVLLIAEILDIDRIEALCTLSRSLGMATLIEVHNAEQLDGVLVRLGPPIPPRYLLGINNRDLTIQQTDLATCARLGAALPSGVRFVAESGIWNRADVKCIARAGAGAMLIGESILRAADRAAHIRSLLENPRPNAD